MNDTQHFGLDNIKDNIVFNKMRKTIIVAGLRSGRKKIGRKTT